MIINYDGISFLVRIKQKWDSKSKSGTEIVSVQMYESKRVENSLEDPTSHQLDNLKIDEIVELGKPYEFEVNIDRFIN